MGKKNITKSQEQRQRLENFFLRRQGGWQRDELLRVSASAGLTRQQVYKWLWDRKRAQRHKIKLESSDDSQAAQVDTVSLLYRNFRIEVPANKQQAAVFHVHPSVSVWALLVLKHEGWQLVRDNPHFQAYSHPHPHPQYHHELRATLEALQWPTSTRKARHKKEEIYESES